MRPMRVAAAAVAVPAGGSGANAGGWLDAATRNTAITNINAMVTELNDLKADYNDAVQRLTRYGILPPGTPLVATADALAVPAGGTGATAGGYDTAGNRDLAISRINDLMTLVQDLNNLLNRAQVGVEQVAHSAGTPVAPSRRSLDPTGPLGQVPAGGTGAAAGCYDSAANRDIAITNINGAVTLVNDIRDKALALQVALVRVGAYQA